METIMQKQIRLIGGHAAYRAAVRESYRINAHNPGVWYSATTGFSARSTMHPEDETEMVVCHAAYSADTGNQHQNGNRAEYAAVRAAVAAYFDAIDRGLSVRFARQLADFARQLADEAEI